MDIKKNKLDERKKAFFKIEEEKRRIDEEEKKFQEYEKQIQIDNANRFFFENQDAVNCSNKLLSFI